MSKSYKKFPRVKYEKNCKTGKRFANKKVRTYLKMGKDISNGRSYKKIFNSAEICDYSFIEFKEWAIQNWYKDQYDILNGIREKRDCDGTLEEALLDWKKFYKRK